jgi:23S rRNA (adenine-N6)-dimethyltransferase
VVDVGAGHGELTRQLLAAGARVIAVELHPGRAERLRERFAGTSVTVVRGDALSSRWPGRPFRVVANPPYGISAALLRVLLAPRSRLVAADLVMQRAVVRRCAEELRGPTSRWRVRAGLSLPRNAFRPPPRVDSAVLVIRRR